MHDVFISYATEDAELAQSVCRRLEADGIACWIAPRDISPGKVYAEAIVDAIASARAIVLLLSASANASAHVHREVELAGGQDKPIVPVMLEKLDPAKALQYFIRTSQWLNAEGLGEDEWVASLAASVRALVTPGPGVGSTIGGRLRLEEVLGEGGKGTVFLAEHLYLGGRVAVKVLKGTLLADADARQRFLDQAKRAREVQHPHIVAVLDAGIEEGLPYLVLDYVAGGNLRSLVAEQGPLDPAEALRILEPIAQALDYAHENGLVHRDVKPANILISSDAHVFLTDFGIAPEPSGAGVTRTAVFVGTLEYAAPEQIKGLQVDARTDVYALGCVLYHCLAGVPPFEATTDFELMKAHTELPRPRATEKRPELPPEIDEVIAQAMATDPEERHQSCGELLAKARAALEGGMQTRAWEEPPAERKPRPEKRKEPEPREPKPEERKPVPPWKRKPALIGGGLLLAIVVAVVAVVAAGGGGDGGKQAATTGQIVTEVTPPPPPPTTAGSQVTVTVEVGPGDAVAGEAAFASAGCAGCHTLAAAGATGTIGPNLDESLPSYELVIERVTNGQGGMPSFRGVLDDQQIRDVAAYVAAVAGTGGAAETGVTETVEETVTVDSAAAEQELRSHVPAQWEPSCTQFPPGAPLEKATAAVQCDPPGNEQVWYFLFPDTDSMYEGYWAVASAYGVVQDSGSCEFQGAAESTYFRQDEPQPGRLLCWLDANGNPGWVWTRDQLRILSWASTTYDLGQTPEANRAAFLAFWGNAGPNA